MHQPVIMRMKSTPDKLQYDNTSGTWGRDHYWALKKKLYKCLSTVSFTVSCYSLQLVTHWQLQCLTFTIWWWVHTDQFICLNMLKSPSCSSGITLNHMQINIYSIFGSHNKIPIYCSILCSCKPSQCFSQENGKLEPELTFISRYIHKIKASVKIRDRLKKIRCD